MRPKRLQKMKRLRQGLAPVEATSSAVESAHQYLDVQTEEPPISSINLEI